MTPEWRFFMVLGTPCVSLDKQKVKVACLRVTNAIVYIITEVSCCTLSLLVDVFIFGRNLNATTSELRIMRNWNDGNFLV